MAYKIRTYTEVEISIEAIQEIGETITLQDVKRGYVGDAVDVCDEKGNIVGSLIYVPICSVQSLKE